MPSLTLYATADTNIYNYGTFVDTNFGTGTYIRVGEANSAEAAIMRSLIKFNLSSLMGLTINSIKLRARIVDGELSSNARDQSVYILRRNWIETEATWNKATSAVSWGTAGAANTSTDRYSTAIGTTNIPASPVTGDWYEWTLNLTEMQKMITGTYTNNGFILQAATEANDQIRYSSREGADAPQLLVTFEGGNYWIV